jgi:hypothetical protein
LDAVLTFKTTIKFFYSLLNFLCLLILPQRRDFIEVIQIGIGCSGKWRPTVKVMTGKKSARRMLKNIDNEFSR